MRYLFLMFLVFWSDAHAEKSALNSIEDNTLGFILNNFSLLLEKNNPDEFPGILRLIELPDQSDDCSWVSELKGISDSFVEENCPLKILYLTLSNWDIAPDQHAYQIGLAKSWKVNELVVAQRNSQSDWKASLSLEAVKFIDGRQVLEFIQVDIINKYDVYSIQLRESTRNESSGDLSP